MAAELRDPGDAEGVLSPEQVLHVVRGFDRLLAESAPIDDLLALAAQEGSCTAGVSDPDGRVHRAVDAGGRWTSSRPDARRGALLADGAEVWLAGSVRPADHVELILERLCVAARVALRHGDERRPMVDATTALEIVLSAQSDEGERTRALRVLRLSPSRQVVVAAYDGPVATDAELLAALGDDQVLRAGRIGQRLAVVLTDEPDLELPVPQGGRIGISIGHGGHDLADGWREARIALRFALPSKTGGPQHAFTEATVVPFSALGAWAIVAEHLPAEVLRLTDHADIAALDRLVSLPEGDAMRRTLETVAATCSIRQAAGVLHLHHNSVAHRVARAEAELDFSIGAPYGRSRLLVGLILQRLRSNV